MIQSLKRGTVVFLCLLFAVFLSVPMGATAISIELFGPDDRVIITSSEGGYNQNSLKQITPVPEPGTMLLFGSGLIGLAAAGRKKFRKNNNRD